MRLNERPLVFPHEELAKRVVEMQIAGNNSFCHIVFFSMPGGGYTWRGEGQKVPHGTEIVLTAKVLCPNDGWGRFPLDVFVDKIVDNVDASYFCTCWAEKDFLEPHEVMICERPLRVWFKRLVVRCVSSVV